MKNKLIGKIVKAKVTRVEAYGLYLAFDEEEAIVLIPDVSCEPVADLAAKYRVGDEVGIRILRYVQDRNLFNATIKDA